MLTVKAQSQDLTFKDSNFEKAVLLHQPVIDLNGDGKIQKSEANAVRVLTLTEQNIVSANDAHLFPGLEELNLSQNRIESLQLVGLNYLKSLDCTMNQLKIAEIRNIPEITSIMLNSNSIDSLIIDNVPKLESLSASDNLLRQVTVSACSKLEFVNFMGNRLTELDLTKNRHIVQAMVSDNNLTELDISKNPKMKTFMLYVDPTVKLITTSRQERAIKRFGLGITVVQMPSE